MLLLAVGGLVLWLTLAVSIEGALAARSPARALGWAPWSAQARAKAASDLLSSARDLKVLGEARQLATEALTRDPTSVLAARTLGVVEEAEKRKQKASILFTYSAKMSRRDLATQIWFLERAAQVGSITDALHHYDVALRTSKSAPAILYPILLSASADPAIAAPLSKLMATRPPWLESFVGELVYKGTPGPTLVQLTAPFLDVNDLEDREALKILLRRLAREKQFDLALQVYRRARKTPENPATLVRNDSFSERGDLGPFDWIFTDEPGLSATAQLKDDSSDDYALYLTSNNGRGGKVAEQLLQLKPGPYRLSVRAGAVPADAADRPTLQIRCARGGEASLLTLTSPEAGARGAAASQAFTVPGGSCDMQWLTIVLPGRLERQDPSWIDDVVVSSSNTK